MKRKGKTEKVGALWRKNLEGEDERVAGRQMVWWHSRWQKA